MRNSSQAPSAYHVRTRVLTLMEVMMDTKSLVRSGAALACALCAFSVAPLPAAAQDTARKGDPARWYRGDSTQQQRLDILRKEIDAAYAQQQADCRRKREPGRAGCLKQASRIHRRDMANAPSLVAQAPTSEVREKVLGPVEGGATAVGSSSGGATGAGAGIIQGKDDTAPPRGDPSSGLPPPRTEPEPEPNQAIENLPPPRR